MKLKKEFLTLKFQIRENCNRDLTISHKECLLVIITESYYLRSNLPTATTSQMSGQLTKSCKTVAVQHIRPAVRRYRQSQVVQCIVQIHPGWGFREHFVDVSGVYRFLVVQHLNSSHLSSFAFLTHSKKDTSGYHVGWHQVGRSE